MLHLWYAALAADVGVEHHSSDVDFDIRLLYRLRKEANDPDLSNIKLLRQENSIVLIHKRYFKGNKLAKT